MRKIFSLATLVIFVAPVSAQKFIQYLLPDSARYVIQHANTEQKKYKGYFGLDRYYYTTGQYDSSRLTQTKMYSIARGLNSDSLLADTYHAIANMLVHKSDYNFALVNYFKALDYAKDDYRRARAYAAAGYVYMLTGNDELGMKYVWKADSISNDPYIKKVINIFSGVGFDHLKKPDSALVHLTKAETDPAILDATMTSTLLIALSLCYELKDDNELADVYYKKSMAFCKKEKLVSSFIRNANRYCSYLLKRGDYAAAKTLAMEVLSVARQTISNDGLSNVAENLKKIYGHENNRDSAFYYAEMQIAYKDSVSNQKRVAEFQNISFAQQLRDIDEQTEAHIAAEQRQENLQYALMALGIVIFIIVYLLVSRSFIANTKIIEFFGIVALLIVFEFLNLLLHPYLEKITRHSPLLMLVGLVCIAALLVPLHHRLEKWATRKLVAKNKEIRLAAAKKTIRELESNSKLN
jgi:hypothetical protein